MTPSKEVVMTRVQMRERLHDLKMRNAAPPPKMNRGGEVGTSFEYGSSLIHSKSKKLK